MHYVDRRSPALTQATDDAFSHYRFTGRISAHGSNIFVANNVIAKPTRNFIYQETQRRRGASSNTTELVLFDYANHIGVDINKSNFGGNQNHPSVFAPGSGYYFDNVIVRDNWVFNRGNKNFEVSGQWAILFNNHAEKFSIDRTFPFDYVTNPQVVAGASAETGVTMAGVSFDGWSYEVAISASDYMNRGYDMGGRNVWVGRSTLVNSGSIGNDGEGVMAQEHNRIGVFSWAFTDVMHGRADKGPGTYGEPGWHGTWNMQQFGLLLLRAWSHGSVGVFGAERASSPDSGLNWVLDVSVVGGNPGPGGVAQISTAGPGPNPPLDYIVTDHFNLVSAPANVTATVRDDGAVHLTWEDTAANELGFRVERRIDGSDWRTLVYRPMANLLKTVDASITDPLDAILPEEQRIAVNQLNPQAWVDFTAPLAHARLIEYRVVAINSADDLSTGISGSASVFGEGIFTSGALSVDGLNLGALHGQKGWEYISGSNGLSAQGVAVAPTGIGWSGVDGGQLEPGQQHIFLQSGLDGSAKMNNWLSFSPVAVHGSFYLRMVVQMETRPAGVFGTDPYEFFFGFQNTQFGAPWSNYIALKYPLLDGHVKGVEVAGSSVQANDKIRLDEPMLVVVRYNVDLMGRLVGYRVWIDPTRGDLSTPDVVVNLSSPSIVMADQSHLKMRAQNMPVRIDNIFVSPDWEDVVPEGLAAYSLVVNSSNGSVSLDPELTVYPHGTEVTLTAVPASGYAFSYWSGAASGSTNPLVLTMDGNKTITAHFTQQQYTVTFDLGAHGTRTGGGLLSQTVAHGGSAVAPTVAAAAGWDFTGWDRALTNITGNVTIRAQYSQHTYTLLINATNGNVSIDPLRNDYLPNTIVQLTATPDPGYVFSGWSGDATGSDNPLAVSMNANKAITANFLAQVSPPTNFRASYATHMDRIELDWDNMTGITRFELWRGQLIDRTDAFVIANPQVNFFDDISPNPGVIYYYWLRAVFGRDRSEFVGPIEGLRRDGTRPEPPANFTATQGTFADRIQLSWSPVGMAASYDIFRSTQSIASTAQNVVSEWRQVQYNDYAPIGWTFYYWVSSRTDDDINSAWAGPVRGRAGRSVTWWGSERVELEMPDALASAIQIELGLRHGVALLPDGRVGSWGSNFYGQTDQPEDLTDILGIAAGYDHSLALLDDGTVRGWGDDSQGQAPAFWNPNEVTHGGDLLPLSGPSNVVSIAAGLFHSVALLANGQVTTFGGSGGGNGQTAPADNAHIASLAAGNDFNSALLREGEPAAVWVTPATVAAAEGSGVVLRAATLSTGQPRFQWKLNGEPIQGATQRVLRINQLRSGDFGNYSVVVDNGVNALESEATLLELGGEGPWIEYFGQYLAIGDHWGEIPWLGRIQHQEFPWIYHQQLGWLYCVGWGGDEVLFVQPAPTGSAANAHRWLWSSPHAYPHLYDLTTAEWVLF